MTSDLEQRKGIIVMVKTPVDERRNITTEKLTRGRLHNIDTLM